MNITQAMNTLKKFMSRPQIAALLHGFQGEEGEHFETLLLEYARRIEEMPKTYEQDGLEDPMAFLHYFMGESDFYITEKDMSEEQLQAFGFAILNGDLQSAEMGYISIKELIEIGMELDLHFAPKSIGAIKKEKGI